MPALSLTVDQTARLRHNVSTAHHRRTFTGPVRWITYIDGPLQGVRVPESAADTHAAYLAWCQPTPDGPVQVVYERFGGGALWRFHGLERGVV